MKKSKTPKQIIARFFSSYAKDASPEEIEEVVTAINEAQDEEPQTTQDEETENKSSNDDDVLSQVLQEMKALKDEIITLKTANEQQNDPLAKLEQKLENEITSDSDEEVTSDEDITEDDDIIDDDEITADEDITEDDDIIEDDDIEATDEEPTATTADKKAMLNLIRTMRPVVAKMKDGKQKRAVTDSLMKLGRSALGKPSKPKKNGYAAIMRVKHQRTSQFIAQDSKKYDESQLGKQIAKRRNPHYKLS